MRIRTGPEVAVRHYHSTIHIESAAHLARLCAAVEKNPENHQEGEHRAFATGAILTAVAFLEATINEVLSDAVEDGSLYGLKREQTTAIANEWRRVRAKGRVPMTDKFKLVLRAVGHSGLSSGKTYFNMTLLVELRDKLVHFNPEWTPLTSVHPPPLEAKLMRKFAANQLADPGTLFFPDRCLGHGCAQWAVRSALEFTDAFFSKLGVPPRYELIRVRLRTE